MAAQQAALVQAERDRTTALADAQRDRAQRLTDREQTYTQGYGVANRGYLSGLAGVLWDLDYGPGKGVRTLFDMAIREKSPDPFIWPDREQTYTQGRIKGVRTH